MARLKPRDEKIVSPPWRRAGPIRLDPHEVTSADQQSLLDYPALETGKELAPPIIDNGEDLDEESLRHDDAVCTGRRSLGSSIGRADSEQ